MRKLNNHIFLIIMVISYQCSVEEKIEDSFQLDEGKFQTIPMKIEEYDEVKRLWSSEYSKHRLHEYIIAMRDLRDHGYFETALKLSDKIDSTELTNQEKSQLYLYLGNIYSAKKMTSKAIKYYRFSYLKYPFNQDSGYNTISFYADALVANLHENGCKDAPYYLDSLILEGKNYPEKLWVIGGESQIEEFRELIDEICDE